MQPKEKFSSRLTVLLFLFSFLVGCASSHEATAPYFKDIYEESQQLREKDAGAADGATTAKPEAVAVVKKRVARIVAIPDPQQKEMVTARLEKKVDLLQQKAEEATQESKDQKPQELKVEAAAGDVQFSVENMPIYDFINLALGEMLHLNYTVANDVQSAGEKITLNMGRKMDGKEFFPFVVDLIRKNNLEIRDNSGILAVSRKIQPSQAMPAPGETEIYVGNEVPPLPPQKRVTLIFSTSYVQAGVILQIVRQLQMLSGDAKAELIHGGASVSLTGTIDSLNKIVSLFNQFDRQNYFQREMNLVYFDYINVVDFDKKLREFLPATGIPFARTPSENGLLTITFDKINALLVITQKKEWLDAVLDWKDKLDAVSSMGDDIQLFVYLPKNRPAEELVDVLKSVATGGSVPTTGVAAAQGGKPATPSPRPETVSAVLPGKNFTAILDKGRNAIIITSSPANYKLVRDILSQLDTQPKQVLIEATIAEVTLTDQLQFGVEWFIRHSGDNVEGTISTLGGLALGGTGLNYAITKLPGDFQAKLNTFASKRLINIISTPHIVVLDGREATINVGTEVPIVTAETSASDIAGSSGSTKPSILRSVQYRSTGVILRVKPVVNSEGVLTIDVGQELSEAQANSTSNIDSPLILNRNIHTTLSVRSGDTVLLGGLISKNRSNGESKVPILGDIPLLGRLFKTDSTGETKTELIVQITPYILNDMEQLDMITRKFKESIFLNN
jgi:general secretion pathway protein D